MQHSYGANVILDNVTCAIERKSRIAILGINGAGKSTLLKVLLVRLLIHITCIHVLLLLFEGYGQ